MPRVIRKNTKNRFLLAPADSNASSDNIDDPESHKNKQKNYNLLEILHVSMGIIHIVQTIIMFVWGWWFNNNGFRGTLSLQCSTTPSYIHEEDFPVGILPTRIIGTWLIGRGVWFFLFVSSISHFVQYFALKMNIYKDYLSKGVAPIRWIEYAIGASWMIILIAQLAYVTDLWILTMLTLNVVFMNFFGFLMESKTEFLSKQRTWLFYFLAWIPFIAVWAPIISYFLTALTFASNRDIHIPLIIYFIIFILLIFYISFGLVKPIQSLFFKGSNGYIISEYIYMFLSLTSKSILAWMIFGGSISRSQVS